MKHTDVVHAGDSYSAPPPPPSDTYSSHSIPAIVGGGHGGDLITSGPVIHSGPVVPPAPSHPHPQPPVPVVPPAPAPHPVPHPAPAPHAEPSNSYRAPPSFPPPMAEHGSSSSSYLDGFQPSQPIPVAPAPPPPLYDLPAGSSGVGAGIGVGPGAGIGGGLGAGIGGGLGAGIGGGAAFGDTHSPAPIDVLPPAPIAPSLPIQTPSESYESPRTIAGALDALDISSQLGYDDPIIEIVFEDGEPAPPPPPPIIDPELFALQEEPVEVYFIEYSPGDNIDDIAALNLDGAQPAILHDLPEELPFDVRSQLLDSGVLDNAEIQVIDLDDALGTSFLDQNARDALAAVYGSESRLSETKVRAPRHQDGVDIRVHRLLDEDNNTVEALLSGLSVYKEGRFAGVVEVNDKDSDKFVPVVVDGNRFPLPEDLEGREVAGVLVLANSKEDDLDRGNDKPPANTSDPEFNLVEAASRLRSRTSQSAPLSPEDREWYGNPDDWRPIWN